MQPIKKCQKVAPNAIFTFFGSKIPYKKQDEIQKLFLNDLMLLTTKGFSSLNTHDNIWMHRLALKLDPKLIFLYWKTLFNKVLTTMVVCCLDLHVQLQLDATPIAMATLDLWMNKG